jgi:hypothetical protein
MSLRFCLLLSFLSVSAVNASQFHFQLENDVTFGEDGNYSNGMIFGWESDAILATANNPIALHNWLQGLLAAQQNSQQAWGLKVSQRMWTPDEIKIAEPQPYDRPYAGYLEFEQHVALYSSYIAQKSWLALGIMGPASGTEQLQGSIHKVIGASTPLGWQHQVENTATIQLAYEIDYLLLRNPALFNSQWEVSTYSHNALGNVRSELSAGLTLRWGTNLEQSFGRLSSHFGHVGNLSDGSMPQSLLFYTRLQGGYRFNDLTIDGNLPYESNVEFTPQQASASTGLSYYFSGGSVTWSFNVYSKEYLTDNKRWHGYGLLQVAWSI